MSPCFVNGKYYKNLDLVDISYDQITKLEMCHYSLEYFCEFMLNLSKLKKMINLQVLSFGNDYHNDNPIFTDDFGKLISIVKILVYDGHQKWTNITSRMKNITYKDKMIISKFKTTPDINKIKYINIIANFTRRYDPGDNYYDFHDDNYNKIQNLKYILQNLPEDLDYLQVSINNKYCKDNDIFTNLPINLKTFNLHLLDINDTTECDISKIKISHGCTFKWSVWYKDK